MNEWYSALPQELSADSTSLPHVLMLHLGFWWCMLLLHRPVYRLDRNPESSARKVKIVIFRKIIVVDDLLGLHTSSWQSLRADRSLEGPLHVTFRAGHNDEYHLHRRYYLGFSRFGNSPVDGTTAAIPPECT